jgi:hypothetical protein
LLSIVLFWVPLATFPLQVQVRVMPAVHMKYEGPDTACCWWEIPPPSLSCTRARDPVVIHTHERIIPAPALMRHAANLQDRIVALATIVA